MATSKLLRGIVTLAIVVWIKVSASRDIYCNGRDFECDGAHTYITCIYLPDGEKLFLPRRCKPGTICNPNNTAEEPCDLDSVPNTTISTASTSTADLPTTVGEASTLPYVRSTRRPDYVLSERLTEIDIVNETITSALQRNRKDNETDAISVNHSVNVTNGHETWSNSSANVTTLTSIEPPAIVKTSSIVKFDRNYSENDTAIWDTAHTRPAVVETNTTVQRPSDVSGSSQLVVSTFTKTFFQFSKIQTQSVVTFSNTQIANTNGSTVSINVATGVSSPGTNYSDDFSVTTNTTVYFGSTDGEPMMGLKMESINGQPGFIVFKNNETTKTDLIVTTSVPDGNISKIFENNSSRTNHELHPLRADGSEDDLPNIIPLNATYSKLSVEDELANSPVTAATIPNTDIKESVNDDDHEVMRNTTAQNQTQELADDLDPPSGNIQTSKGNLILFTKTGEDNSTTNANSTISEISEIPAGVSEKFPDSIHSSWQHSPMYTNSEDSKPTTISLNWTNGSESALGYDKLGPMVNMTDFGAIQVSLKNESNYSKNPAITTNHSNGLTIYDLAVQEDDSTVSKRHSNASHHQITLEDDLEHAIGALIAATIGSPTRNESTTEQDEEFKRTTLTTVAELILNGHMTELPGERTIQHSNHTSLKSINGTIYAFENSTAMNPTVENTDGRQTINQNPTADASREGKMYYPENIVISDSALKINPNKDEKAEKDDKIGAINPIEYTRDDITFETSTVEITTLSSIDADIASIETTTIQIETTFESNPTTVYTNLFADANSEAASSETTLLPTTEIVSITETIATTENLPDISTKLFDESTISPNWPDLAEMNPHPVVSETTFEILRANGESFNGLSENGGELARLKLKKQNGNQIVTEDTPVSTATSMPEIFDTEQYTTEILFIVNDTDIGGVDDTQLRKRELIGKKGTSSPIGSPLSEDILGTSKDPQYEVLSTISPFSPNLTNAGSKGILLETQLNSSTELTTIVLEYQPINVTERMFETTTSMILVDNTDIPLQSVPFPDTTQKLIDLQPSTLPSNPVEEYATYFATEAPIIIAVVSQNRAPEPIEPKTNGSQVLEQPNVSENQTRLATNNISVAKKPRVPFDCTAHGVFPDEDECRQYYLCVQQPSGYVKITGSCAPRFAFDFSIHRCVRDVSSCYAEKCVAEGNYPDPSDNTSYFWCTEVATNVFHKYHMQCDSAVKFNPDKRICEISSNQTSDISVGSNKNAQIKNDASVELRTTERPAVVATVLIEKLYREMTATTNKYETAFIESFPVDGSNPPDDQIGKSTQGETTRLHVKRSITSVPEFSFFECSAVGIFANNLNCSQYYMCVQGEADNYSNILRECPYRYAYHDKIKSCSRDLSVCTNLHSHCKGIGNFVDPRDEKSYYRCVPNASGGLRIYHIKCEGHKRYSRMINACSENESLVNRNSATESNEFRKILIRSTDDRTRDDSQTFVASDLHRRDAERKLRVIVDEMRDEAVKQYEANLKRMQSGGSFAFKCKEEGRFADPNNCRMYYICSAGRTDRLIQHHLECRGSDRFDASKRICVDEEDARCV